jgi:predicted dienelactone hydrolase
VEIIDLFDSSRQRAIPLGLYPYVGVFQGWLFFSVGFGGSRTGYAYLGRAWSQLGFQVAVIEHIGSNAEVLKSIQRPGMRNAELAQVVANKVLEPQELRDRPLDLAYARRVLCPGDQWAGLGGHSFGSYTALAGLHGPQTWAGLLLMSPQPPGERHSHAQLAEVRVPCLVLTGTKDSGMPAGVTFEQRILTYQALPAGAKALGLLQGADHMAFAGIGLAVGPHTETVAALSAEFWTALRQGRSARWPSDLPVQVDLRVG